MTPSDRLAEELAALFSISAEEARQLTREQHEAWDSLKHIEVLYLLEDEFDLVPSPDELVSMNSFDALLTYVETSRDAT